MSEAQSSQTEMHTALFLDMIAQYTNMALMFLGHSPHPQTGKPVRDLEAARLFIDQLEVLEAKTRGNLTRQEESLLKQSIMGTRMAFVQAVEEKPDAAPDEPASTPAPASSVAAETSSTSS